MEMEINKIFTMDALEFLAKISDGGMRDAITLLDKCLAYSNDVSLQNVVTAIGTVDYEVFFQLTEQIVNQQPNEMMKMIESLHQQGKDLKLFIRTYTDFVLDVCKYSVMGTLNYTQIPNYYEDKLKGYDVVYYDVCNRLLRMLMHLNSDIKWDSNPKAMIEASLYQICMEND